MSQGLCPSCGAVANLPAEQNQINCTYCGSVVTRQEAEAKAEEQKGLKFAGTLILAETAQEGGSYEEALTYWNEIIKQEPTFADAWLEKGNCMVRTSKIGNIKIPEALSSWKAAIKFAKNPEAMKKRVALEMNSVIVDFYPPILKHSMEFVQLENAGPEFIQRFMLFESALSLALSYYPTSETIAKNGITLCKEYEGLADSWAGLPMAWTRSLKQQLPAVLEAKRKYQQVLGTAAPSSSTVTQTSGQTASVAPRDASKKIPAGICGILLGGFGVHKFILGYSKEGLIQIVITVVTCGMGSIIGFIEGIIYLTKSDADFVKTYIEGKKGWF